MTEETNAAQNSPVKVSATRAFRKPLEHFNEAWSWLLINDQKHVMVHVNTYNGRVGKWKPRETPITDKLAKKLRSYTEVPISQCPVACPVEGPEPPAL